MTKLCRWWGATKESEMKIYQENPAVRQAAPFVVPPFDPGEHATVTRFDWWGLHPPVARFDWWGWYPLYASWWRSCWGGKTEQQARESLARGNGDLDVYAVKLVMEHRGVFTIIEERECLLPEVWHLIADRKKIPGEEQRRLGRLCGQTSDVGLRRVSGYRRTRVLAAARLASDRW
ncbi:MAG: hypothetical protein NTW21_23845 [Verrucomicrobia bacterium]|nr:hypothetical protein [Verrucomicrobiota bacterium]